jgi:uncharacterized protein (TIGR00369 family)
VTDFDGAALIRQLIPTSPFAAHVGLRVVELADGRAVLAMPFRDELVTIGRTVHGGALATLLDTTAMAAAWCGAPEPARLQGSTVTLSISYLAPAEAADVLAEGRVVRRGRSVTHVEVEATADSLPVARALVAYKVG